MPAGRGEEERFAAAVEYGATPSPGGDDGSDGLARELEIVALLRSAGPALSPTPAAKAGRSSGSWPRSPTELVGRQNSSARPSARTSAGDARLDATPVARRGSRSHGVARHRRARATRRRPPLRAARGGTRTPMPRRAGRARVADADLGPARPPPAPRARPERPAGTAGRRCWVRPPPQHWSRWPARGPSPAGTRCPATRMYGVKRVAESTGYALTFGEQAKARRHLEQAQRRLDEVEGMVTRDQTARASDAPADPPSSSSCARRCRSSTPTPTRARACCCPVRTRRRAGRTTSGSGRPSSPRGCRACGRRSRRQDKADESLALLDRLLGEADARPSAACDPAARTVPRGGRRRAGRGDTAETGPTLEPDGTVPRSAGAPDDRTRRCRATDDTADDDSRRPTTSRPTRSGSSDDDPTDEPAPRRLGRLRRLGGPAAVTPAGPAMRCRCRCAAAAGEGAVVAPGLPGVTLGG